MMAWSPDQRSTLKEICDIIKPEEKVVKKENKKKTPKWLILFSFICFVLFFIFNIRYFLNYFYIFFYFLIISNKLIEKVYFQTKLNEWRKLLQKNEKKLIKKHIWYNEKNLFITIRNQLKLKLGK